MQWAQNSGKKQLACETRLSSACYQNVLLLTAQTTYIQLQFFLIFRYFIFYNLIFAGQNKKKIDLTRG